MAALPTTTTTTTPHEVALLRLAAHRLAAPSGSAAEVTAHLGAAQGQDHPGAVTAVALRTGDGTRACVDAALSAGQVVRSWPMRGTLHLVPAEDLGWMLSLTTDRLVAQAASRRASLGLDDAIIGRAREVAVGALEGGRRLRREDLLALWDAAGLLDVPQRGYHLIWHLAQTGTLCFGPGDGGREPLLVLLDEWVPAPRRLEREEALGELALRFLTSHGPATRKDLARWTGLLASDVTAGIAVARPRLEAVLVDGVEHLMGPGTPELLAASRERARGVHLLPGFDEYLLGYADRSAVLAPEHSTLVVPGGNGVFRPTVVADGRVVGTWRRGRPTHGKEGRVETTPFETFDPAVEAALPAAVETLPH